MNFHLFVASCVYALAIVYGIIFMIELFDPSYRARLRRKIRKIIVRILKKFIKD